MRRWSGRNFKVMENDPPWFGCVAECEGAWAVGDAEATGRTELREALERWILLQWRFGDSMPQLGDFCLSGEGGSGGNEKFLVLLGGPPDG